MVFQRSPWARIQTILPSTGSRQAVQVSVSSIRLIACGDGSTRMGFGSWPTLSAKLCKYSGQALKKPLGFTAGSCAKTPAALSRRSSTMVAVQSAIAGLPFVHPRPVEPVAELADQFALGPGEAVIVDGDGKARAVRTSPVASTEPSASARSKKAIKRNANGDPVHSFAGLIDHLGAMTRNTMRMPLAKTHPFTLLSRSTPLQDEAFKLLGLDPMRVQ